MSKLKKLSTEVAEYINQLTALELKCQELQAENSKLKHDIETGITRYETTNSILLDTNEDAICRKQLQLLHDQSLQRTLTLEEARKVEIYVKILRNNLKANEDSIPMIAKTYSSDELKKIINETQAE